MRFTDQMGNTIFLKQSPRRIISLVPSQTELLFDLDLDEEIVGITRYCVRPEEKCVHKTKIGGTKKFRFDIIDELQPDVIIGNKEENYPEGIEILQKKYPVWMSDIQTLTDALEMIASLGELVNRKAKAEELVTDIWKQIQQLSFPDPIPTAYLIWKNPFMAAGGQTFINEMLTLGGFMNIFGDIPRYPEVSIEQLQAAEVILLSSEPYPFTPKDVEELGKVLPKKTIQLTDGTMFSWYGSRLKYAPQYLKELRNIIRTSYSEKMTK